MDSYLRSEVLECFAYKGKISKSMVEREFEEHTHVTGTGRHVSHHHPEILAVFEYLRTNGLIKELNTNPGPGLLHGRGRPQKYHKITEKGLRILLADKRIPAVRFWKILHGYCQNNDDIVTLDKIEEFYQILIGRYLKYPNRGFFFQLGIFHKTCENWLQDTIGKSNKISTSQRVIETLAIYPKITFEKMLEKMGDSASNVQKVRSRYSSPSSFEPGQISYLNLNTEYTEFIIHNILTARRGDDEGGKVTYELSLFGVILCLLLIRYNYTNKLKTGLYFKDLSRQEYYDRIASNYKKKLPLIFGKWSQLSMILKELAVDNFDIVLKKDEIIAPSSTNLISVVTGGTKELCDGIKTILLYNGYLMMKFAIEGWNILEKYIQQMLFRPSEFWKNPDFLKIYPLCAKLGEVITLLKPTSLTMPHMRLSPFSFRAEHVSTILQKMERLFADEIAAFYYMNLQNNFPVRTDESSNHTSKETLSLILEQDKDEPLIREWLSKWKNDLVTLQEEILQNTKVI